MLERVSRVHLVGIGGIGMSAIAMLLTRLGHEVSGSDQVDSRQARGLSAAGARIFIGEHRASNVGNAQLVVVSSAVEESNVEVRTARERAIPVAHRGDVLADLMKGRKGIAVAGSHGKTTTSAMIGLLLLDAGLDPTCVIGGLSEQLG